MSQNSGGIRNRQHTFSRMPVYKVKIIFLKSIDILTLLEKGDQNKKKTSGIFKFVALDRALSKNNDFSIGNLAYCLKEI